MLQLGVNATTITISFERKAQQYLYSLDCKSDELLVFIYRSRLFKKSVFESDNIYCVFCRLSNLTKPVIWYMSARDLVLHIKNDTGNKCCQGSEAYELNAYINIMFVIIHLRERHISQYSDEHMSIKCMCVVNLVYNSTICKQRTRDLRLVLQVFTLIPSLAEYRQIDRRYH